MAEKLTIATGAADAVSLKYEKSAFLAGGTEINRLGSVVQAQHLISIKKVTELKGISEEEDTLRIGAGCTFTEILEHPLTPDYLRDACRFMAAQTKRNMATIGGNIALLRSDSYLMPTLLAAGAKLELLAKHRIYKTICIETYLHERENYADELIMAVVLPKNDRQILSKRYANTAESHAVLTISMGGKGVSRLSLAAAIKNAGIYDLSDLAVTMEANPEMTEEELIQWANTNEELDIQDDMFGSAAYKRYLLGVTISLFLEEFRKGGAR